MLIHSQAAEFKILPYFIAVGNHEDQPIFPATSQSLVNNSSEQAWWAAIPLYH